MGGVTVRLTAALKRKDTNAETSTFCSRTVQHSDGRRKNSPKRRGRWGSDKTLQTSQHTRKWWTGIHPYQEGPLSSLRVYLGYLAFRDR
jgi:hypothetical protein